LADATTQPQSLVALRNRSAAYTSWANTEDPTERTAPARAKFMARFEREVDPDRCLTESERARRAEAAKKAYFVKLAYRSAVAARTRRATG
jgi:hypothetical protein